MVRSEKTAEILGNLRIQAGLIQRSNEGLKGREDMLLPLGMGPLDRALAGGLYRGALHEISALSPSHIGAASSFVLALMGLAQKPGRQMLWIEQDFAAMEGGRFYAPGLQLHGLAVENLLLLRVAKAVDALWAMEEALSCRAFTSVAMEIAEIPDLTATRRLQLASQESETLALVLRQQPNIQASAARTRWNVSPFSSPPDIFGGIGRPGLHLDLTRNRQGPCGSWTVLWDPHERRYRDALSFALAAVSSDGPDIAPSRLAV